MKLTSKNTATYDNNYQYNSMMTKVAINDGSGRYDHGTYYGSAPKNIKQGEHFGAVYTARSLEEFCSDPGGFGQICARYGSGILRLSFPFRISKKKRPEES